MTVATLTNALTSWMVFELQGDGFIFDPVSARYRDNKTGRYVADSKVVNMTDGYSEYRATRMEAVTKQYINGKIDVADWQGKMRQQIKDVHIISATAGRGGRESMSQADWGRTGGRLRQQYAHLDSFAWEVASGDVSEAQMLARAKMYAGGSRTAYNDGKVAAAKAAGFTEERRVLGPVKTEHCLDCQAYAALGWQPIGTLPEPGQQAECLSNCKCDKEFRGQPKDAQEIFIIGGKRFDIPDEPKVSKPLPKKQAKRKPKKAAKPEAGIPVKEPKITPIGKPGKPRPAGIPVSDKHGGGMQDARDHFADEGLKAIDSVHGDGTLPRMRAWEEMDKGKNSLGIYKQKWNEDFTGYVPDRILVNPKGTHKHMTFLHETAHFLDDQGIGSKGVWSSQEDKAMEGWRRAVHGSKAYDSMTSKINNPQAHPTTIKRGGKTYSLSSQKGYLEYSTTDEELWARSYAQYVAEKSDSPVIKAELKSMLKSQVHETQWEADDFKPISEAIDNMFKEMGWQS